LFNLHDILTDGTIMDSQVLSNQKGATFVAPFILTYVAYGLLPFPFPLPLPLP
jgi:hypothetical protein